MCWWKVLSNCYCEYYSDSNIVHISSVDTIVGILMISSIIWCIVIVVLLIIHWLLFGIDCSFVVDDWYGEGW